MFNQGSGYSLSDIAAATGSNCRNGDGMFGENGWWIILLFLFAWGGNGFGWGNGNGAGGPASEVAYGFDVNEIQRGIASTHNGICDGFYAVNTGLLTGFGEVQNTLGQNFSDLNTAINLASGSITSAIQSERLANLQNTNAITTQLNAMQAADAACCCETQRLIESNFADLGYRLATQECATRQAITDGTREIIQSNNDGVRSILEFLTQDKISQLQAENQGLKFAASQAAQNNYLIDQLRPSPVPAYVVQNPYCCGTTQNYSCGTTQNYCCGTNF